ncbi:protein lethal(2)essential for life-like [Lycorma delicatula]|uniref:protein lethal(2)essential for life-like n=1 Tax=Lycorma delicatula TaxID=130591 RepID=UPI003F516112
MSASSLLPLLVSELLDEYNNPVPSLYDQHFGLGLHPNVEMSQPRLMHVPLYSGYLRPWRQGPSGNSGVSSIVNSENDFRVSLDVQQFKPEEITVKLQDDFLVVDAKHEERQDKHGFISRHFTRRYKLPENVDTDQIKSNLSSDGVLTLTAPKKVESKPGERSIPIERTNQPALKQRQGQSEGGQGEGKQEKMES